MKATIKVKVLDAHCTPQVLKEGDWIDLKAAETISLGGPKSDRLKREGKERVRKVTNSTALIPLGVAMQLPKGYEAIVALRSSSPKKYNIIQRNAIGVIDNSYNGPTDEWKLAVMSTGTPCVISEGDRIAQFRIQLSQKATVWQKIKWLFTSGVKIKIVRDLKNKDRGGFGSTGNK